MVWSRKSRGVEIYFLSSDCMAWSRKSGVVKIYFISSFVLIAFLRHLTKIEWTFVILVQKMKEESNTPAVLHKVVCFYDCIYAEFLNEIRS